MSYDYDEDAAGDTRLSFVLILLGVSMVLALGYLSLYSPRQQPGAGEGILAVLGPRTHDVVLTLTPGEGHTPSWAHVMIPSPRISASVEVEVPGMQAILLEVEASRFASMSPPPVLEGLCTAQIAQGETPQGWHCWVDRPGVYLFSVESLTPTPAPAESIRPSGWSFRVRLAPSTMSKDDIVTRIANSEPMPPTRGILGDLFGNIFVGGNQGHPVAQRE